MCNLWCFGGREDKQGSSSQQKSLTDHMTTSWQWYWCLHLIHHQFFYCKARLIQMTKKTNTEKTNPTTIHTTPLTTHSDDVLASAIICDTVDRDKMTQFDVMQGHLTVHRGWDDPGSHPTTTGLTCMETLHYTQYNFVIIKLNNTEICTINEQHSCKKKVFSSFNNVYTINKTIQRIHAHKAQPIQNERKRNNWQHRSICYSYG